MKEASPEEMQRTEAEGAASQVAQIPNSDFSLDFQISETVN